MKFGDRAALAAGGAEFAAPLLRALERLDVYRPRARGASRRPSRPDGADGSRRSTCRGY